MSSDGDGPDVSFQAGFGSDGELEVAEGETVETDLTDWGVESDDREEREPRDDVAKATEFGQDDRPAEAVESDDVETSQGTLGDGTDDGQATLEDAGDREDSDDQDDRAVEFPEYDGLHERCGFCGRRYGGPVVKDVGRCDECDDGADDDTTDTDDQEDDDQATLEDADDGDDEATIIGGQEWGPDHPCYNGHSRSSETPDVCNRCGQDGLEGDATDDDQDDDSDQDQGERSGEVDASTFPHTEDCHGEELRYVRSDGGDYWFCRSCRAKGVKRGEEYVTHTPPGEEQDEDQDDDSDDGREYHGWGSGRRRKIDAVEEADRLEPIDEPETLEELLDAVRDLSLDDVRHPPERVIEKIESVHGTLPEEARTEYVSDAKMVRTVNAARRYWTKTYLPRLKRDAEMPGPMEAGPSKYNYGKRDKRRDSLRKATNELGEKVDRIKSRAGGAKQRALNAIGSSVAEQNEKEREDDRETLRDVLEPGKLLQYRNPSLQVATVKRVNKKSVRLIRPNPYHPGTKPMSDDPEPEYRKETKKLTHDFFTLIDRESYPDEIETVREFHEEIPADYDEAVGWLSGGEVSAPEPQD